MRALNSRPFEIQKRTKQIYVINQNRTIEQLVFFTYSYMIDLATNYKGMHM